MKKLLMLILIGLLLTLTLFVSIKGVKIGSLEILGIQGIQEKSKKLDDKIQEAGKLASKDFPQAINSVKDNAKKLEKEKQNYDEMTAVSTDGEVQTANQIDKYEIEALWVKLGNHATKEGAVLKMDVEKGSNTTSETYNLRFTVTGSYIAIEEFISNVENDSSLGFKIEEFKLVPGESEENLQATFVCKDIAIKEMSENTQVVDTEINEEGNTNSTNSTSNKNSTNSTKNTNSTNSTNSTNVAQ